MVVSAEEFSRFSGSYVDISFAAESTLTPLLRLAFPWIPLFFGDADRGGGIDEPDKDLRVERAFVGVGPAPTKSIVSARRIQVISMSY